jgi:rare lipoprotein A
MMINSRPIINKFFSFIFLLSMSFISSCKPVPSKKELMLSKLSTHDKEITKYEGHYKTGKSYTIKSKTYTPVQSISTYKKTGVASWYGRNDHGKKTANGDKFNINLLTAAHKELPLPSVVKVTNLNNGKALIVMVNDRGPFHKNRIIDVSEKAAELLDFKKSGVANVKVEYLSKETKELLDKINLQPKHGKIAKAKIKQEKCSVNCHIKLFNLKHNLLSMREAIRR